MLERESLVALRDDLTENGQNNKYGTVCNGIKECGRAAEDGNAPELWAARGGTDIFVGFQPWTMAWVVIRFACRNPSMTFLDAKILAMQIRRETAMGRIIDY